MTIKIEFDIQKPFKVVWQHIKSINIWHVLLLSLALHLFLISIPSDGFIFDEAHYVPASLKTLNLQPANAEHPPLTKIIIAVSIAVFGDFWFAWRIPIVIFGIASLYIVYLIAKKFMSERYALLSAAFLSFDIIFFVHGSIAILDMPAVFFSLLAIFFFLDKKYWRSTLSFAVAFLCLERTLFFMFALLIYSVFAIRQFVKNTAPSRRKPASTIKPKLKWLAKTLGVSALIFITVTFGGLYIYEVVYKPPVSTTLRTIVNENVIVDQDGTPITTTTTTYNVTITDLITNPIQHILFGWKYYFSLAPNINPEPQDFRPPWSWTLPIVNVWNPPHYLTVAVNVGQESTIIIDWVSQISYPIAFMFWPTFIFAIVNVLRKRERSFSLFYIAWTSGTYLPWILFGAFFQRMTFNYYFLATTPILAMGVPYFWNNLPVNDTVKKIGLLTHLAVTIVFFMYFFPVSLFRA